MTYTVYTFFRKTWSLYHWLRLLLHIIYKKCRKSYIQSKSRNVFIDQFKYNYSIYPDNQDEISIFGLIRILYVIHIWLIWYESYAIKILQYSPLNSAWSLIICYDSWLSFLVSEHAFESQIRIITFHSSMTLWWIKMVNYKTEFNQFLAFVNKSND